MSVNEKHHSFNIKEIIEHKSLSVCFQQIVSISRKTVSGIEGLIRGANPVTNESIPPLQLFQAAKRQNLTLDLDRACRTKVLESFRSLYTKNCEKLLFLNVDASILDDTVGSDYLLKQVKQFDINPGNIVIEINETKVLGNSALRSFADAYRRYGFMVALDDVGTGFSNMDRILLVKPDMIKIDLSLVKNISKDFYKQGIFKSLVSLSKKIGALVIAEGVETEEEAIAVLRLGGHMIQGFYFSVPSPYDEKTVFSNHKIDVVSKRFNEYMHVQFKESKNNKKVLFSVVNQMINILSNTKCYEYEEKLSEMISDNALMECAYILDENGIQISNTVSTNRAGDIHENLIFYAAKKGTDHSMEKYYYPLVSAKLNKYVTEPYVSLATGNLCITVSVIFSNAENKKHILCLDFKTGNDAHIVELKGPAAEFGTETNTNVFSLIDKLSEEIIRDSLTGAYNRRYIEERLLIDVFNATNEKQPVSIILADIDHFKLVNDLYGHPAGDEVLKTFVKTSKRFIRRQTDWIARYGGDEFLLVLLNADEEVVVRVAEAIRSALAETEIVYHDESMKITASFGTYTVHSEKLTCDQLIRQADKNLYKAKTAGRNKVSDSVEAAGSS
jgi:diguanylate cyclase (GGDEF)-like protein